MRKIAILILIAMIIVGFQYKSYEAQKNDISNRLIRLHVIANSDSTTDQAVKLMVRDAVIKAMDAKFEGHYDINKARSLIKSNLKDIEDIANNVLRNNHLKYTAKAVLGRFDFPIKSYGPITLPAGNYEALRIVLGNGEGKNWWCVMFPPLCFTDITHGLTTNDVERDMSNVMTKDQMKMIDNEKNQQVVFKFKIIEVIENSLAAFAKSFRFAFR